MIINMNLSILPSGCVVGSEKTSLYRALKEDYDSSSSLKPDYDDETTVGEKIPIAGTIDLLHPQMSNPSAT